MAGSGSAWADESTLTFTAACGGSGTADDDAKWAVTSDANESTYDSTKGIHYGTGKAAVSYLNLSTSDIEGTITKIVVNASGASATSAKLNVTVGGSALGSEKSLTSSAANYTFEGSASGEIIVALTQTSATKALYVKSIAVTYTADSRANSDLTITSSTPIALEMTTATPTPTSNITWDTSSEGDMTFISDATDVATVSNTGVITAIGAGTATITVSQAADDHYKASENKTVTVNVSDNRDYVATSIDLPAAQKTLTLGDMDDFAPTATVAGGFGGSVTYTYSSNNTSVVDIDGTTYSAEGLGSATITITATPTGGNAANYRTATQDVVVNVKGTTTLSLSDDGDIEVYGTPITFTATVATDYDGTLEVSSDNESVATAAVDGTTVTVTSVAVGAAKITVTAPATSLFNGTVSKTFDVEFTKPEGKTTAYKPVVTVFEETFEGSTGTNGSFGIDDTGDGNGTLFLDNTGWSLTNDHGANDAAKFGASSKKGSATTPGITVENGKNYTLTFKAAPWASESTSMSVTVTGGSISGISSATMSTGVWNDFTGTITASSSTLKITISASNNRFFLDEVKVIATGEPLSTTLNSEGYATFCSEYPLDFSDYETADYSAWQITSANSTTGVITFSQITGYVKGGTGILLKGTAGDPVTLTSVDSSEKLEDNLLVGTLAPTYVAANEYYGLSGANFVPVNAGTVPAGKALLPATAVSGARQLTFIFEGTQGISDVEHTALSTDDAIYSISGQRVSTPKKGLYIMNGKKVVMK